MPAFLIVANQTLASPTLAAAVGSVSSEATRASTSSCPPRRSRTA